jgi:uncharacterized protein (TIGR03546 family)
MFWFKLIRDFISILREGQTPAQVAGGFALGSILGLSPMLTLQGVLVWLIILILNVNLSATFVALTVFSFFAFFLDPLFHWFGFQILTNINALQGLWTSLYSAPIAPLTRFNNTVVMGSFVCALLLFIPVYLGMKRFVVAYRATVGARVEKLKVYQMMKRSSVVQWYQKVRDFGGRI